MKFVLQVNIKVTDTSSNNIGVPLVVELAYVISRLHMDTFPFQEISHNIRRRGVNEWVGWWITGVELNQWYFSLAEV